MNESSHVRLGASLGHCASTVSATRYRARCAQWIRLRMQSQASIGRVASFALDTRSVFVVVATVLSRVRSRECRLSRVLCDLCCSGRYSVL